MTLKHVVIGAVAVAALALGGLWLFLRQQPAASTLSAFQATCLEGQRRGISGGALPLDDETETRMVAFCSCVEREVDHRLSEQDIAAIALEQSSKEVDAKVGAIVALCRDRNP
jgi:hypothetical protein